ncbi:hypothetical protein V5O48_016805 [Marasmius crinis-equi]|uniref:Uncharacterized protein n=1 Tax=Marasmius crinis-equi TaxID=585013 RepID=A0ABR3EQP9_9AGAR
MKIRTASDVAASKKRGHANRDRKRKRNPPKPRLNHLNTAECAEATIDTTTLPSTSTGYSGKNKTEAEKTKAGEKVGEMGRIPENREYRLDEVVDDGVFNFELIKHRPGVSQYVQCKDTKKIMSVVIPGPCNDPTWDPDMEIAADVVREAREKCHFSDDDKRRGLFDFTNFGASIGMGQPKPMMLMDQGTKNRQVMEMIRCHDVFRRIAGFMTICFACWAPELFAYYQIITNTLLQSQPELRLPFDNSIFAAFTVNFGPRTICLPHRDQKNLAFGWCAITSLGRFNWKKGGHLILWELGIVIEFPPGTIILVPSAIVCHSNTSIASDEDRYSFTMYSAGGLFRWVEHGFQLEYKYQQTRQAVLDAVANSTCWATGLSLFSTYEELVSKAQ